MLAVQAEELADLRATVDASAKVRLSGVYEFCRCRWDPVGCGTGAILRKLRKRPFLSFVLKIALVFKLFREECMNFKKAMKGNGI